MTSEEITTQTEAVTGTLVSAGQAIVVTIACPSCGTDVVKTGFIVETESISYQAFDRVGPVLVKSYKRKSGVSKSQSRCTLCHGLVDVPAEFIAGSKAA